MGALRDTWNTLRAGIKAGTQIETRAPDADFIATAVSQHPLGMTDASMPTEQQVRRFNRGVFAKLVEMRGTDVGAAISDSQVLRNLTQGDTEEVEYTHPWLQLIRRPSPYFSAREMWKWGSMVCDLWGTACYVVEDDSRGMPVRLHPVWPLFGHMETRIGPAGEPIGYTYWRADGKRLPLELRDVVMLRHTDPISPQESQSLLERAAYQLDKSMYADIYERDNLKEGRFPPAYISSDQDLSGAQMDKYGKRLQSQIRTGNVKGVLVLGAGSKLVHTGVNPKDMAFIEGRAFNNHELTLITGVHEALFAKDPNRANIEGAMLIYKQFTIQPLADLFCAQLTTSFEQAFGADPGVLEIVAPDVVPVDQLERARIDEINLRSGRSTINEIRQRDGDPAVQGGDLPHIPAGMVPLGSFSSAERDTKGQTASRSATDEWSEADKRRRKAQRPVASANAVLFRRQKEVILDNLRGAAQRSVNRSLSDIFLTASMLFDLTRWITETLRGMDPSIRDALRDGWEYGAFRLGEDPGLEFGDARITAELNKINGKIRDIPQETLEDLNRLVQQAYDDDLTLDELAALIDEKFEQYALSRAETIAETSGGGAFEAGNKVHAETVGAKTKMWVSRRDGRQRRAHRLMDGVTVPINQPFTVPIYEGDAQIGTEQMDRPLDPEGSARNVIRCRCTAVYGF